MHIAHYYPRAAAGNGGMSNAVRRLSAGLAEHGARVTIVYDEPASLPDLGAVEWRRLRHLGRPRIKLPLNLPEAVREADVLLLHSGWILHNVLAGRVARRAGIPYVVAPRGAYDPHILARKAALKRVWWMVAEKRLVHGATAMHLFFSSERQHAHALGFRGPTIAAPNGIDPPAAVRWDGGSGEYVLWMGRFDPEHKGLDLLLEATAALPADERPSVRLHGPDWRGKKALVVALAARLGLDSWVTVGDPVYGEEKWDLLSRARAFVYPSRWEGFGNSVAEAVSIGVPTLTTPYPLGQYLANKGGAFVGDCSREGLAGGLRRVCSQEAPQVGDRGRQIITEEFNWDRVSESWLTQLEGVL